KPRHLEVILWKTPAPGESGWQAALRQAAPGLIVEGQLGSLVTVLVPADRAIALADLPIVSAVRLPRSARLQPETVGEGADAVKALGLDRLRQLEHGGRGIRIAIIDADFKGYAEMVKARHLPANTRLVDLTAERSPDLTPDPFPTTKGLGHGTLSALA